MDLWAEGTHCKANSNNNNAQLPLESSEYELFQRAWEQTRCPRLSLILLRRHFIPLYSSCNEKMLLVLLIVVRRLMG